MDDSPLPLPILSKGTFSQPVTKGNSAGIYNQITFVIKGEKNLKSILGDLATSLSPTQTWLAFSIPYISTFCFSRTTQLFPLIGTSNVALKFMLILFAL